MDSTKRVIATGFEMPLYFWGSVNSDYKALRQQSRLILRRSGATDFVFPIDPFISLSFRNSIARRYVAKGTTRGTIKERWTEDDVEITINGVFVSETENKYPAEADTLRQFFEAHEAIEVSCDILNNHGISRIAIESLDFAHTKGIENQAFQIKAWSDDVFEFLEYNNG